MNAGISVIKSQSNVLGRGLTDLEQRRRELMDKYYYYTKGQK